MDRAGGIVLALALAALAPAPASADLLPPPKKPRPTRVLSDRSCVGVPSLSTHEIRMAILAGLPAVRACYRTALARRPGLAGTLHLDFDVSPDGRPVKISAKPPALSDAALQRCALQAFAAVRFKSPRWAKLGQTLHVTYPIRFAPAEVDGPPPPTALSYVEDDDPPRVATVNGRIEVSLPQGATAELAAAFPQDRLPRVEDFAFTARGKLALPLPFALAHDLDSDGRNELVLVLVGRQAGSGWRLVVLHRVPGKTGRASIRVVTAAEGKDVQARLQLKQGPDAAGLFLTRDGQCYCDRRCLSIASDGGVALELEWDGNRYRSRLERYVPR
jgi:TonB family protein